MATTTVQVPAGDSNVTLQLTADSSAIRLWWPNGMGDHPLYNVTAVLSAGNGETGSWSRCCHLMRMPVVLTSSCLSSYLEFAGPQLWNRARVCACVSVYVRVCNCVCPRVTGIRQSLQRIG